MIHLASISRNESLGLFSSMIIIFEGKRDCVIALDVGDKWEILLDFSLEFTQNDIIKRGGRDNHVITVRPI